MLIDVTANDNRPVLVTAPYGVISARVLTDWGASAALESWRAPLRGRRVAVVCHEPATLALTLLALDGVAAAVILPPPGVASTDDLVAKAGAAVMVSDQAAAFTGLTVVSPPPFGADLAPASAAHATPVVVTQWVLTTSGTTRTPKWVEHTRAALIRSVKRDATVGAECVWGLVYDLRRFAGLQVFFQAVLGGSSLVIPPAGETLPAMLARFAAAGVNAVSATPTLWRKLLMTPESAALALRRVTLGGEIADDTLLNALRHRFPEARIVHIYASTEAGVGFSVSDGRAGFPECFLTAGVPGAQLRVSADGILEIRPESPPARYLGETEPLAHDDGFVNTGDRVRVESGRVFFLGRDSGAINVGGLKVQPEEVERVLLEHPAVAMAAVGAKRSGITGALVEARVVLRPGVPAPAAAVATLRAWCDGRLERHKVPALIRVVDSLEMGASGKIERR